MEVDHGGGDIGMTEKALNGANVRSRFQEMSGEAVSECMGCDALGDTRFANRFSDLACHRVVVEMIAGDFTGARVRAKGCGGKHELPAPLTGGARVFPH